MQIRVYYDSTDSAGVVYHTEYIKFCEQARSEIFFKHKIFFEKEGFVVKDLKANFLKSAKLGDILDIKTNVIYIKKASVLLLQEIYRNEEKIFNLEVLLVFMKNNKISKIDKKYLEILSQNFN